MARAPGARCLNSSSQTGKTRKAVVAEHAHVKFPTFDIFLRDSGSPDPFVNEGDPLDKLFVGVYDGCLGYSQRCVFAQAFDDKRKTQPRRTTDLASHRKYYECRRWNTVIGEKLFRQIFAAGEHEAAWVAARIRNPH